VKNTQSCHGTQTLYLLERYNMSLKTDILEDARVSRALSRLKKSSIDPITVYANLQAMHSSRPVRALNKSKVLKNSNGELLEANLTDIAFRSNLVEQKLNIMKDSLRRQEQIKAVSNYIMVKYASRIKEQHKTVTAQRAYVKFLLEKYTEVSSMLEDLLKVIDLVVEDIDSAGWALKRVQEIVHDLKDEKYR
jgi:tRNA U34 5-carboxymethylaminomethyl modifying GTPase MnmE/TrmE